MKEKVEYGYLHLTQDADYAKRLVEQLQLGSEKAMRQQRVQKAAQELLKDITAYHKKWGDEKS